MTSAREVQRLGFATDAGQGPRALLGLIVLETDRTVEAEFRALYRNGGLDGVAHHASRIPMEATVTAETLAAMEERLPVAAGLLPPAFDFDAIGYACTSGATLIGEERVAELVGAHHPGVPCTNPLTAAVAAFRAFGVIDDLEADVGRPIVSSNQALSWHLLRLAGLEGELSGPGRLFRHGLPS